MEFRRAFKTHANIMFKGDAMNISHEIAIGDNTRHTSKSAVLSSNVGTSRQLNPRRWLSFLVFVLPLFVTACGDTASLATVSTEGEAIEILNVLHENGIEAHKEDVGEDTIKQWRLVLDQSWFGGGEEVALANQVLQDNGLPRARYSGAAPASDTGGVFKDEATRKAEQLKEREADLQNKLRLLPGVIGVEVSIVEPEDSSIKVDPYPATAAVMIVSKDDPPNFDPATIRGLVARSVPKLNADSVYVAITTKPVKPLPWREMGARRRHKILDAVGIGVMFILASSIVVLLLQMRRQNSERASLRDAPKSAPSRVEGEMSVQDLALPEASVKDENETTELRRAASATPTVS